MGYILEYYEKINGSMPFNDWLNSQDSTIKYKIIAKLERIELGNLGDVEFVGDGVSEIKLNIGPGIRIYYSKVGLKIILLLSAGTKRAQQKDIEKAKQYLQDYKERGRKHGKK